MKSLRKLVMPLLLALAAGNALHAEDPTAELMQGTLPPGVYRAHYMGNPNATHPCAYFPAYTCLIIVSNTAGQSLTPDNLVGPVIALQPSTRPEWKWEATTAEQNKLFMENTDIAPPVE